MLAAAVAAVFALAFVGADLAEDALPGEMLYEVKRSTEALELETAVGDSARGAKHLELASTRVAELESLAGDRDVGRAHSVHRELLTNLETHATTGAQLVTTTATRSGGDRLEILGDWAAEHAGRMRDIETALPAEARARARAGAELLTAIEDRAKALAERMTCYPITTGRTDELGAVPATGSCAGSAAASTGLQQGGQEAGSTSPGEPTASGPGTGTAADPTESGAESGTPHVQDPVDMPGAPAATDEPSAPDTGVDVPGSPQAPSPETSAETGISDDTELTGSELDELETDLTGDSG
nr:DUF5667 domain-containing protein [Haloechinothrix aidingensis]